jgi:prepilin-type N-terminal cleavage/methylation domain-containing protein
MGQRYEKRAYFLDAVRVVSSWEVEQRKMFYDCIFYEVRGYTMQIRRGLKQGRVRSGFTLIELLVVVGIIGILTALVFPAFKGARERGYQTSCAANLKQVGLAMRLYYQDERQYPNTLAVLLPDNYVLRDTHTPALDYIIAPTSACDTSERTCPNPQGTGYLKSASILLCGDDEKDDEIRSSYGDVSTDLHGAYSDETGEPAYNSRYVWNYYGYNEQGLALKNYLVADTESKKPGKNTLLYNPAKPYDKDSNVFKYSLSNRFAPVETIVTHCIFHRTQTSDMNTPGEAVQKNARDVILRLDGAATTADISTFEVVPAGGVTISTKAGWQNHKP